MVTIWAVVVAKLVERSFRTVALLHCCTVFHKLFFKSLQINFSGTKACEEKKLLQNVSKVLEDVIWLKNSPPSFFLGGGAAGNSLEIDFFGGDT